MEHANLEHAYLEALEIFEKEMVPQINKLRNLLEVLSYRRLERAVAPNQVRLVLIEFCLVLQEVIVAFDQYHARLKLLHETCNTELEKITS
jgi:hypothetical protein